MNNNSEHNGHDLAPELRIDIWSESIDACKSAQDQWKKLSTALTTNKSIEERRALYAQAMQASASAARLLNMAIKKSAEIIAARIIRNKRQTSAAKTLLDSLPKKEDGNESIKQD